MKSMQDGIAVKLCCAHAEIQLPPMVTIGCAICWKRCCGGASGRDKDQRSLDEISSTREVFETSGAKSFPVWKVIGLLKKMQVELTPDVGNDVRTRSNSASNREAASAVLDGKSADFSETV